MTVLLVLAGGAAGSALRYLTDRWVQARHRLNLPLGTLLVNLAGCLVLGLVAGAVAHGGLSPRAHYLLGDGLCGGLTTFSAFSVEVLTLTRDGRVSRALAYAGGSIAAGIALAALGQALV